MAAGVKVDLAYSVLVQEHPGAAYQSFGPGGVEIPKWAAKQMGDHCFADGDRGNAPAYAEPAEVNQVGSAASAVSGSAPSAEDIQALIDAAVDKALAAAAGRGPTRDGADGADKGYSAWTVDQLKAEIDDRNADGRDDDDHLSKSGKKDDLVAALEADDVAQADEDPDA